MENVYDIKRNNNLNFILPSKEFISNEKTIRDSCLIVIYLFYADKVEKYLKYVEDIPHYIDILIVTSNIQTKFKISIYMDALNRRYQLIEKENRGRDVSSFLIACKKEILRYKYVCFLHDKQEKGEETKIDTEIFENCLWENMVGSGVYIDNILTKFEGNSRLGVLLPPESLSDNFSFFFKNTWDKDFNLMQLLAKKLGLKCNLDEDKKPISLGTVFWAKVDSIKKLLEFEWKYEDFDDEPMASDGTISHAIERCFAYVAQDAGYDTGIVMTDRFAGNRMDYFQEIMTSAFRRMEESLDICTVNQLNRISKIQKELINFANRCSSIYVYGVGRYGKCCAKLLQASLYQIKCFVVSEAEEKQKKIGNISIRSIMDLELEEDSGIIIAVSNRFRIEIEKKIKEKFPLFKNIFVFELYSK